MRRHVSVFNRAPKARSWFTFQPRAQDSREAEVLIYDEISWYGVEAGEFVGRLQALDVDRITVRINSPGGSVFDGLAIANALKAHPAEVRTQVDGIAASIASVIALAGDEVGMAQTAYMMIHDPWAMVIGTANDLREVAGTLDKVGGTLRDVYVGASGLDADEVSDLMAAETWLTAPEALEMGFATEVTTSGGEQARFDLSIYNHPPESINAGTSPPGSVRELERLLRDAGFSRSDAKAIAGNGFAAARQRDAGPVEDEEEAVAIAAAVASMRLQRGNAQ